MPMKIRIRERSKEGLEVQEGVDLAAAVLLSIPDA
jgi:hypothetical protein